MKATMEVPIIKTQGGIRSAWLEVDLPFSPHVGMPVWHVAWKDSREVKGVSLQFDENNEPSIIVSLEPEQANSVEEQNQLIKQYKGHGWTA
jgi:hypothetical protein